VSILPLKWWLAIGAVVGVVAGIITWKIDRAVLAGKIEKAKVELAGCQTSLAQYQNGVTERDAVIAAMRKTLGESRRPSTACALPAATRLPSWRG